MLPVVPADGPPGTKQRQNVAGGAMEWTTGNSGRPEIPGQAGNDGGRPSTSSGTDSTSSGPAGNDGKSWAGHGRTRWSLECQEEGKVEAWGGEEKCVGVWRER